MNAPLDKPLEQGRPDAAGEPHARDRARPAEPRRVAAALSYLWIGIGSALGGVARYAAGLAIVAAGIGGTFPWATVIINVSGSMLIGFFATLTGPDGRIYVPTHGRQFVMVGFCGGYTTFSSFALQTLTLAQDGQLPRAAANIAASLMLCFAGVWVGHAAAAALNG